MLNYWWVTRPKRKLNSVPEVLSAFAEISLNQEWESQRDTHLSLEETLEKAGLKRIGERRDHTGGGGRTYKAWVSSLGLIFTQKSTKKIKLTLAGEAIINGENPVKILKNQILKYQFPSPFSLSKNVKVSSRFKIRPFRFLLRLLSDSRINYLTEEEIAKIIVVEAENETLKHYEYILGRILEYRNRGDNCLEKDFYIKYKSSKGEGDPQKPYAHLFDLANTLVNWLEYTQLIKRENGKISIFKEKEEEVKEILKIIPPFIDKPEEEEIFQRKYGLDLTHKKDTRNLIETKIVTPKMIAEQKIRNSFITEASKQPISKISVDLIEKISEKTGFETKIVESILIKLYPHGAVGSFMAEYFEMAFRGREDATEFEKATVKIFKEVFGFKAEHVGPKGLTPDVLLISDSEGYQAIIDNKAYAEYNISNDHRNRMIHNYIGKIKNYSDSNNELVFFSYIAGGFGKNFDSQIKSISDETGIKGSGINVFNMIRMIENHNQKKYNHNSIRNIFSINREILLSDL